MSTIRNRTMAPNQTTTITAHRSCSSQSLPLLISIMNNNIITRKEQERTYSIFSNIRRFIFYLLLSLLSLRQYLLSRFFAFILFFLLVLCYAPTTNEKRNRKKMENSYDMNTSSVIITLSVDSHVITE